MCRECAKIYVCKRLSNMLPYPLLLANSSAPQPNFAAETSLLKERKRRRQASGTILLNNSNGQRLDDETYAHKYPPSPYQDTDAFTFQPDTQSRELSAERFVNSKFMRYCPTTPSGGEDGDSARNR